MHGFFRFLLPILAAAVLAGCAARSTEERLEDLEASARDQHLFDLRISNLEERVTRLETDFGQTRDSAPKESGRPVVEKVTRVASKKGSAKQAASPVVVRTVNLDDLRSPDPARPLPEADPAQPATSSPPPANAASAPPPSPGLTVSPAPTEPSPRPVQPRAPSRPEKTASQAYDAALALYNKGEYNKAHEAFAAFLSQSPNSPLAPNALYWQGECLYSLGKYDNAIIYFKDVATKYPKHPKAAAALLKAGYSYERLKDQENARFYWQILVDDFPRSAPAALARQRL